MLRQETIKRLTEENQLYLVPQSLPGLPMVREFYATKPVMDLLFAKLADKKLAGIGYGLRGQIDDFIDGKRLWVRPDGEEGTNAWLARLDPVVDEVWEFRALKPKPSVRIFGTVPYKDCFIGLNWAKRKELGDRYSEEWVIAIQYFKDKWLEFFGTPCQHEFWSYPNDYLSNARFIYGNS